MSTIFETERIIVREIQPTDFNGYVNLHTNKNVTDLIPIPVWDIEKCNSEFSKRLIDVKSPNRDRKIWSMELKTTKEFIGLCGLIFENEKGHELAYRLSEPFWNKGFASEVTSGLMDYAIVNLKAKRIFADAFINNHASNKILEKILQKTGKSFSEEYQCWDNHYELILD